RGVLGCSAPPNPAPPALPGEGLGFATGRVRSGPAELAAAAPVRAALRVPRRVRQGPGGTAGPVPPRPVVVHPGRLDHGRAVLRRRGGQPDRFRWGDPAGALTQHPPLTFKAVQWLRLAMRLTVAATITVPNR